MTQESEALALQGSVLFVDDEENILRSLKRLFSDEPFDVFTAPSGRQGLELLKQHDDVGVIVSDQRMPEMTGVDFLEQSRKISPLSVRILLTGYADVNAAVDAINRGGAFRYVSKPWNDEELVLTVKNALQNYTLIKENKRLSGIVSRQNEELKKWNSELEIMVQEQTMELQRNYDELKKMNKGLRANFKNTILAFSGLLELRNKSMRSHARNVAEISSRVGRAMGMSAEDKETLVAAALLHDIGKIGIPDYMLDNNDTDDMKDVELQEYMKHPVRGQTAVDSIMDLRKAGVVIRHHHERYDGTGFPDQLKKQDIPLAARIIAIIDCVDKRIRRFTSASGIDQAFKYVDMERGKRFDPRLIAVVETQARAFYKTNIPETELVEIEISPNELREGMTLSRDVYSGTGILLLSKGTKLEKTSIMVLKRYYNLDPSKHGVFVTFRY